MSDRDISDNTRIQYLRSEIVVSPTIYSAATHLLVGYIQKGEVTDENRAEYMKTCVKYAIDLALITDKVMAATGSRGSGGSL
ncbi:MAG: hypothetical protein WDZ86_07715 [Gammaproteobacteria bacterium]